MRGSHRTSIGPEVSINVSAVDDARSIACAAVKILKDRNPARTHPERKRLNNGASDAIALYRRWATIVGQKDGQRKRAPVTSPV